MYFPTSLSSHYFLLFVLNYFQLRGYSEPLITVTLNLDICLHSYNLYGIYGVIT